MSDLTSLHSQARKLILLLREGLEKLEALEVSVPSTRVLLMLSSWVL
jgi:hypothetical protein